MHATVVVNIDDFHRFFSRISPPPPDDTEAVELCTATLTKTLKDRFHGGGWKTGGEEERHDPQRANKSYIKKAIWKGSHNPDP